jgi:hypothetical protein
MKSLLLIAAVLFATLSAHAYIPSSKFILGRLARNDGKGAFQVEQDVTFRTDTEPVVMHERWTALDGDTLRLSASGKGVGGETYRFEALYRDGKRWIADGTGNVRSGNQSAEFFEPYLYFRSAKGFTDALLKQKVLPPAFVAKRKEVKSFNGVVYPYEPFVRLARTGGAIAWAMGAPTPTNSTRPNPGLWIDQDAFLLRRLRYPSRAEVESSNHLSASGGFRIPRDRNVTWETSTASIRILSVKSIAPAAAQSALNSSTLNSAKMKLPEVPAVQEFYSRFR